MSIYLLLGTQWTHFLPQGVAYQHHCLAVKMTVNQFQWSWCQTFPCTMAVHDKISSNSKFQDGRHFPNGCHHFSQKQDIILMPYFAFHYGRPEVNIRQLKLKMATVFQNGCHQVQTVYHKNKTLSFALMNAVYNSICFTIHNHEEIINHQYIQDGGHY